MKKKNIIKISKDNFKKLLDNCENPDFFDCMETENGFFIGFWFGNCGIALKSGKILYNFLKFCKKQKADTGDSFTFIEKDFEVTFKIK